MFKPASFAQGMLSAPLSASATAMLLTTDLYNKLVAAIGEGSGDTTYLVLGTPAYGEVVRVDGLSGGVATITRARDGTTAKSFGAATSVEYYFCSAAMQDMLNAAALPNLTLTAGSGVTIQNPQTGHYTIAVAPLNISSTDGSVVPSGTYPNINLAVNPNKFGLCNVGISTGN